MGTDYAGANSADGEGPVRPVALSPFSIDAYPVTNADFAAFVQATGYVTESEQYGTSFVLRWPRRPGGAWCAAPAGAHSKVRGQAPMRA